MTKHRDPQERRAEILTAARQCFLENGYFATKMDAIARASELSKGGIYFHFDSKREIFRALVQEEYDTTMSYIDAVIDGEMSLTEKLIDLAEHMMKLFESGDRARFMVIIGEMGLRDDEIAKQLQELQLNYFERVAQLLASAVEEGQIRHCDTYNTAVVLKAMLDGVQMNYALGIDIDLEKTVTAAMEILMQGLTNEGRE